MTFGTSLISTICTGLFVGLVLFGGIAGSAAVAYLLIDTAWHLFGVWTVIVFLAFGAGWGVTSALNQRAER